MAKKLPPGPSMFDLADEQEAAVAGKCTHPRWLPTLTVWPGETEQRMTMTCEVCGFVRGWYYEPRYGR